MGSALGNVFNSSDSKTKQFKTFALNSQGFQSDRSVGENITRGPVNIAGALDPAELNWFTTGADRKEQAQFVQDQVVAGQAEATAQKTQADNLAMIADEERKRKLLGGGRASTILSTAMGSSGGRRYLGGA